MGGVQGHEVLQRGQNPRTADASAQVTMLVNSNELSAPDFHLTEVSPLRLDSVTRGVRRTNGAVERKLQGVFNSTFVLSVKNDNDFRSCTM